MKKIISLVPRVCRLISAAIIASSLVPALEKSNAKLRVNIISASSLENFAVDAEM
jgi:hypothetical protein